MARQLLRPAWNLHKMLYAISLLCAACTATSAAWAGTILQLQVGSGGTVSYGSGRHHTGLRGNNIRISQLDYGLSVVPILMGRLVFRGAGFATSHGNLLLWGPGGSLFFRGCADLNSDAKCDKGDLRGTLITGSFLSIKLVDQGGKQLLIAQVLDQINPQLAARLGLPVTSYHGELELLLAKSGCCRGRVRDIVQGGFLKDFFAVPEPLSILLLGFGLVSLVFGRMLTAWKS